MRFTVLIVVIAFFVAFTYSTAESQANSTAPITEPKSPEALTLPEADSLIVHLVDSLLQFYDRDYVARPREESESDLMRLSEYYFSKGEVNIESHTLRSREGQVVTGYDGKLYRHVDIESASSSERRLIDSLFNVMLRAMEVTLPLKKPVAGSAKSPPMIIVKGKTRLVVIQYNCENFITAHGERDYDSFWHDAEEISTMVRGFMPEYVIACGCGGPLRDMMMPDSTGNLR